MSSSTASQIPSSVSTASFGRFRANIISERTGRPIENVTVQISDTREPDRVLEKMTTDETGQISPIELSAPPVECSMEPYSKQPYSEYNILISAPGFKSIGIRNMQILSGETAIQELSLLPDEEQDSDKVFAIPPHTLFGEYPPKIAEDEMKPLSSRDKNSLSKVVIPETIIVHDGAPNDISAKNYYIRYTDYIKSVVSHKIYASWPEAALQANILAVMSSTLNRIYTEWYRNKGYQFMITTSAAFDHKWIPNMMIYESISNIVDSIFSNYLSRPDISQPIFTQCCDGKKVSCPNWLSQWGSKTLAEQGCSAIEILRNYYGDSMYINTASEVSGIPSSWPGVSLQKGSVGDKVRQIQHQLNVISNTYPMIQKVSADGIYGLKTAEAVRVFEKIFHYPQTGVINFRMWYRLSAIYVKVCRKHESN